MKITYTPNPLKTIVELDEHEVELLRLKIHIDQLEECLCGAQYHLDPNNLDVEKAKQELEYDERMRKHGTELLDHYINELRSKHIGDCTCVACPCSKCYAEQLVGVDTLAPYPGKHVLYRIAGAFYHKDTEKSPTIEEALEYLRTFKVEPPTSSDQEAWARWEQHAPRWKAEATEAYEYLLNYRNTHFSKEK